MLTERQIKKLKAAAKPRYVDGRDNPLFGTDNPLLNDVIAQIKDENPHDFLTENDLHKRAFFHKPKDSINAKHQVVYASYVTPYISDRI